MIITISDRTLQIIGFLLKDTLIIFGICIAAFLLILCVVSLYEKIKESISSGSNSNKDEQEPVIAELPEKKAIRHPVRMHVKDINPEGISYDFVDGPEFIMVDGHAVDKRSL